MSTTIDQKVVEMRFDNAQFERNVSTTMSTLEKLKQKLSFSGASKGLEDLNSAAKKVDMTSLGNSVETVGLKFNAMYTMADQALRNITNRVMQTGERMVKALTLDPIKSGFQEYETQMNSVQTILANTQSKGSTIKDVNEALDELNTYADKTIYNFTEMTRNIGTFTAAGIDLDTSVNAIQGIANLAAVSGSTSQQASTAMYQLSQALASGTVKLMDWNSVVNAGMGGQVFQDALKKTSELLGTGAESAIKATGSFRESLREGWLTADVLTETLKRFTSSGANEYVAEYTGLTIEAIEAELKKVESIEDETKAIDQAAEAIAKLSGKNKEEIKSALTFAKTAEDAATKVKTFTQLWDVLKESAQSGWAQTWKIIVGDFEEAKAFLSPLAEFLTGIVSKISEARNALLESALGKSFSAIGNKIKDIIDPLKDVVDAAEKAINTIENLDEIALKVIRGNYKNTDTGRRELLMADGYNWAKVQNRVNEMLGDSTRHSVEAAEAELKLRNAQKGSAETQKELNKTRATTIEQLMEMSDAQLKELGLSKEEVKAFRDLEKYLDLAGISMEEFLKDTNSLDGRVLLLNSFKNIGSGILGVFKAIGQAWRDAFPPMQAETLYKLIAGFHGITQKIRLTDKETGELTKTGENLRDTLKGIFAILDIITTITGSVFKVGFKVVQEFLKALGFIDVDILSITAKVGNAIASFRDWLEEHNLISKAIEKLVPLIVNCGKAVVNMVKGFLELPAVQFVIDTIQKGFKAIGDLVDKPLKMIKGMSDYLANLDKVTLDDVIWAFGNVRKVITTSFAEWLDKHPRIAAAVDTINECFRALGEMMGNTFNSWLEKHPKIQNSIENIQEAFKGFGSSTSKMFGNIGSRISDVISEFMSMESFDLSDVGNVFSRIGEIISDEFSKWLNNFPVVKKALIDIKDACSKFGKTVSDVFGPLTKPISDAIEYLKTLDSISLDGLKHAFEIIRDGFLKLFSSGSDIPGDFVAGFVNGIKSGAQRLASAVAELGQTILAAFREVLGIQSPSTETQSDGENFFMGFLLGLKNMIGTVIDFISGAASKFIDAIRSIPWGSIFAAAISIGLVATVKKIADTIALIAAPLGGLGSIFEGVGNVLDSTAKVVKKSAGKVKKILDSVAGVIKDFGKSMKKIASGASFKMMAAGVKDIAIAIGIMVGAVILLQHTKTDDLWECVGVLGALTGIVILLVGAAAGLTIAFSKLNVTGFDIGKILSVLLGIAAAMIIVASAVKKLGTMNADQMNQGLLGLSGVVAALVILLLAFDNLKIDQSTEFSFMNLGNVLLKMSASLLIMAMVIKTLGKMSWGQLGVAAVGVVLIGVLIGALLAATNLTTGKKMDELGDMLLKMAGAIAILAIVVKLLGNMSWDELDKGVTGLLGLVGIMALLMLVTKIANTKKIGSMLMQMAGAMAILALVGKILAGMEWGELAKAGVGLLGLVGIVALLMLVSKIGNTKKIGTMLMQMGGAMALLAIVCKIMGTMEWAELGKAAVGMALLVGVIAALVAITKIAGKGTLEKLGVTLLLMSVSIGILAAIAMALSLIKLGGLIKGIVAVGLLTAMIALMVKSTKGANDVKGTFIGIAIAVGVMAAAIALLSIIKPEKLVAPTLAMTLLMAMFALIAHSSKGVEKSMATIIVMTVAVAALAGVLALLSKVPAESLLSSAAALSLLLLAVTAAFKIVSGSDVKWKDALINIGLLTAMVVPLLAFVFALKRLNGVEDVTTNVQALVVMMGAMTLLLGALALIGKFGSITGIATGLIGLTAMVAPMLVFIWALKKMEGLEDAQGKITSLVTMMTSMTLLLGVLTIIGKFGGVGAAVSGIASLAILFGAIGGLAVAIGWLLDKCPGIQKFLDTGLPTLEQLAGSIGKMIGKFIGGIGEGISDSLVKMGEDIADFMEQIAKASENASGIKGDAFNGVKSLMDVMGDIALTTVGTTIGDIFTLGGTSMEKFEKDGVAFFNAMKAIGEASSDVSIDKAAMESVIGVAQSLADLQSSLEPIGGVISWFTGRDDLGTFGKNAASFVDSMVNAFGSLDGAELNTEAMDTITSAASSLADLQSRLEPIGGVISWFTGRDDLGTFGFNVAAFISSMKYAFEQLDGSELNTEAMNGIVTAATKLSELQSSLEPIGGVISWFAGKDDLGTFGFNVAVFIRSMKYAFGELDGVELNTEGMNGIIEAATKLADLQSHLEPIGGVVTWFTGRDDLGTFGFNVAAFISSMKYAFSELDGVELNTKGMNGIIEASTKLAELQSHLEPIGGVVTWFAGRDDLGTFGYSIASFISSMVTAFSELDGVTINAEAIGGLVSSASKLAEFQETLEPMGGVISWFSGRQDLGTFGTNVGLFAAGMKALKDGMGEDGISETVITSVSNAGNAIVELQKALPEEGWFDGKMNLSKFSEYITDFATAMSDFSSKAVEINAESVSTVINTAYRIKKLIESLVDLDTSGLESFTGIGTGGFGADGAAYKIAQTISEFSNEVANINTETVSTAVSAATKIRKLIASLVDLDTSGIENFKPDKIGKAIKSYNDQVKNIDVETVSSSITMANKLRSLITNLVGLDPSGIDNFKIAPLASKLENYSLKVSEVNGSAIRSSVTAIRELINVINDMSGLNSSGVDGFVSSVSKLGNTNIDAIVSAFDGASAKMAAAGVGIIKSLISGMTSGATKVVSTASKIVTAALDVTKSKIKTFLALGKLLMNGLAMGMNNAKAAITKAATNAIANAASKAKSGRDSFYSAGYYVAAGFASGISSGSFLASIKARAMAKAAVDAAKEALKINSPSKVFMKIGEGVPEGFAKGIENLYGLVTGSTTDMTDSALKSTKSAMNRIADALNGNIDSQPTIRPVLDLSDVTAGAGTIGSLLNMNPSIGLMSNVRSINSMMNQRSQNGINSDVVSAIRELGNSLGNIGGDTYNVNGVTYDDGSNISDAVKSIVRAARVERRI